jgi:hypothetical protein
MLIRCVNCGFYVRPDDEFCLNCGIKAPNEDFSEPSPRIIPLAGFAQSITAKIIFSVFLIFTMIYLLANRDISNVPYLPDYLLFLVFLLGVGLSFLSLFLLNRWCLRQLKPKRQKTPDNFSTRKKIIEKRLSELDRRGKKLDEIMGKIKENNSRQLKDVRAKLLPAREMIISQFARYELQKQKIELAQLQNGVSPYLFAFHRLNEFETESALTTIENTQMEIDKIRRNLTQYDAIEFPEKTLPEKEDFLAQLSEVQNSCEKLREVLLAKQAMQTLQGIEPLEENLNLPLAKDLAHTVETFNIQTSLTDFSDSFDELERDYKRLKAREEIGQRFLKD